MTKATILVSKGRIEIRDVQKPKPGPGQVLVRVYAAALNPTDLKHVDGGYPVVKFGNALGCDYAGVVEELGAGAENFRRVGERIAGMVHGVRDPDTSAFSEYAIADAQLAFSLPDSLSFLDAAGLFICTLTACQMLYQTQTLPSPRTAVPTGTGPWLLVWSGASAVGQYLIQLGAMAGLRVVATASPKNSAYLKELGALETFDYRDPDVGKKIFDYTRGELTHVADCLSSKESFAAFNNAVGPQGGQISVIIRADSSSVRSDITVQRSLAYELLGKAIESPFPNSAKPELYAFGVEHVQMITQLLKEGKLKTTPVKLFHGFESIEAGLDYMRAGKVSREKVTFQFVE